MRSREIAELVKQSVTMQQVVEFYGFHPDRAGFIQCPFHAGDDHGSLKLYPGDGGWHCFGCGRGGTVIDFVMELFGLNAFESCLRINGDLALGLPVGRRPTLREHQKMQAMIRAADKRRAEESERQREYDGKYNLLWDLWTLYDQWRRDLAPKCPEDPIDPRFACALKNIDYVSYRIDTEL